MTTNKVIPFSSQVFIIALFVVFFSVLFSLANAIYSNYQYDVKIRQFQDENQRYAEQNKLKMYEYLRSNLRLVLEKEKKETMNQINPGEQVIVLHADSSQKDLFNPTKPVTTPLEKQEEKYKDLPNTQKWWHYFFD
jgi:hypothetical protein